MLSESFQPCIGLPEGAATPPDITERSLRWLAACSSSSQQGTCISNAGANTTGEPSQAPVKHLLAQPEYQSICCRRPLWPPAMPPRRKRARVTAADSITAPLADDMQSAWQLSCSPGYSLRRCAVSYGFCMLAPNRLAQARLVLKKSFAAYALLTGLERRRQRQTSRVHLSARSGWQMAVLWTWP